MPRCASANAKSSCLARLAGSRRSRASHLYDTACAHGARALAASAETCCHVAHHINAASGCRRAVCHAPWHLCFTRATASASTAAPTYLQLLPDQHFELIEYCLAVHCTAGRHSAASLADAPLPCTHRHVHLWQSTAILRKVMDPTWARLKVLFGFCFQSTVTVVQPLQANH